MQDYYERKEARAERYEQLATKKRQEATQRLKTAQEISDFIPFGQPILVGHHSERSHRSALNKINTNRDKAYQLHKTANYYEQKAKATTNNQAISSDAPDALELLKQKLEEQQEYHATLKRLRKEDKNQVESYQLTNSNGRMRATKKRIEQLEKLQNLTLDPVNYDDWHMHLDKEENRIMFTFDAIPAPEKRNILKHYSFHWSRYNKAWQRKLTFNAIRCTEQAIIKLKAL